MADAQGDPAFLEDIVAQLAANPQLVTPYRRIKVLMVTAWTYQYRLQWSKVQEHLRAAIKLIGEADNASAYHACAVDFGPQFLFCEDGLRPVERLALRILERFGEGDDLLHMGAYNRLASIRFYQGRLEEAETYARRARRIVRAAGGLAWQETSIDHVLLFSHLARGDYRALQAHVEERLPDIRANESYAQLLANYLYLQALACCYQGQYGEARALLEAMAGCIGQWDPSQQRLLLLTRGWLATAEGRLHEAETDLQEAVAWQDKARHTLLCSHARLHLAYLYWTWYRTTDEEARLAQALHELNLLLPEIDARGMPGIALQSGRAVISLLKRAAQQDGHAALLNQILAVFGEEKLIRPLPIPGTPEHLTPRQVEVLHLLMTGATNRQIAAELVITERTAKAHVSHILQKLGVSSRTAAVARARELALL